MPEDRKGMNSPLPDSSARQWEGLHLFDDLPKGRPLQSDVSEGKVHDSDPCRLHPIVEVICSHIRTALQSPPTVSEQQLRIGLFGGLGQGKTSAILQVVEQLRHERLISRFCHRRKRKPRFASFDAADYKADLLEFEFDRLVGRWFLGLHLGKLGAIFASITMIIALLCYPLAALLSLLTGKSMWEIYITSVAVSIILPILAKFSTVIVRNLKGWSLVHYWLRDIERRLNLHDSLWYGNHLVFPPDVLVVDNLDRASVKQQRAILRSIHKYSDRLRLPIVVIMDETELLHSKPYDAEAPEELLRKVIQVECRIPIRMGDDAARLVKALTSEGIENNKGNLAALLLSDARLQGDWTRIFSLLPGLSPRRIKRFLNDILSSCQEIDLSHPDDVAALTRLYALFLL